jgi:hypothetical protein
VNIKENRVRSYGVNSSGSESSEHGNDTSDSIKDGEFLDRSSDFRT